MFGQPLSVVISDPVIIHYLKLALSDLAPGDFLVQCAPHRFRQHFYSAAAALGLSTLGFQLYSLRRGGATADFRAHGLLDQTMLRGRWQHQKTCRIYINTSLADLAQLQLTPAQVDSLTAFRQALERGMQSARVLT